MARKVDLGPQWPVPLYHPTKDVYYAHHDKDVDKMTIPEAQGGPGYSEAYIYKEWPKTMSHATERHVQAKDRADGERLKLLGYSFEPVHPDRDAELVPVDQGIVTAADEMKELRKQLAAQQAQIAQMLAGGAPKSKAKPGPKSKAKKDEAE